jgi:2,3-dihydro-2,3-dihydroxybenzoate dehydrogenase
MVESTPRFAGRVALVVGGRGGMGQAVCRRLVSEGARVFVGDVSEPSLRSEESLLLDVTSEASVAEGLSHVESRGGALDVVVFLAGAFEARPFLESDVAMYERLYAINVFGASRVLREAGRRMIARGGGSVVVVASQSSKVVRYNQAVYGSSKAALSYMTKAAALELAPHGVRCNLVLPGVTETPMARAVWESGKGSAAAHIAGDLARFRCPIPLGRVGQSEDVAAAVSFLASDDSKHITMAELLVDGGSALLA